MHKMTPRQEQDAILRAKEKEAMKRIDKRAVWMTPNGFIDFAAPVTYDEALQTSQKIADAVKALTP